MPIVVGALNRTLRVYLNGVAFQLLCQRVERVSVQIRGARRRCSQLPPPGPVILCHVEKLRAQRFRRSADRCGRRFAHTHLTT
jgi:hypothetical protein